MKAQLALPLLALLAAGCGDRLGAQRGRRRLDDAALCPGRGGSVAARQCDACRCGSASWARASPPATRAARPATGRASGDGAGARRAVRARIARSTGCAAGTEFFICSRTHDQRWFGIVYPRAGQALEACGVAAPASRRGDYDGPCASGWVASARVRLVSGVPHQLPPQSRRRSSPHRRLKVPVIRPVAFTVHRCNAACMLQCSKARCQVRSHGLTSGSPQALEARRSGKTAG